MAKDDTPVLIIGIFIAIFCFLLLLLGIGSYFGGSWELVTQGVAKFILVVTIFALAVVVVFTLVGRR